MPLTEKQYQTFLGLIEPAAAKQEVECARYLAHVTSRLFPSFPRQEIVVSFEERMHFGRSDYLIVGDFMSDRGRLERRVYFWEVKAAQCFLAQFDDAATRVRPTVDLVKAETQLIHYVEEARGSQIFLRKFDVMAVNVKMGGIVIGRDNRLWDPNDHRISALDAQLSYDLRQEGIYDKAGIRVITWDRIAEDLNPSTKGA